MKLKTKITWFVMIILLFTIGSITILSYNQMKILLTTQLEDNLFNIGNSVAENDTVKEVLLERNKDVQVNLNKEIENIRKKTKVDFIVVMDMRGTRLTHPNKSLIGKKFQGNDQIKVLDTGRQYVSESKGSLGNSLRIFVPIFRGDKQIGAVSIGSTINVVNQEINSKTKQFIPFIVIGLILGIIGANMLALNIKKAILGLEPKEIAWMLKEKEAILQNVKEGIIAIDEKGKFILFNKEAENILGLTKNDIGNNIANYTYGNDFFIALQSGQTIENIEIKIKPEVSILCKYNPLKNDKNVHIGAVINFRDLTEVKHMAEELTGIKKMTWALRAQNHEFMNKLHTISGLIQLEEYDKAVLFISDTSKNRNSISKILTEQIKNSSIVALLFAKYNKAEESRIQLKINEYSNLTYLPKYMREDELGSVIGNLLDNSFDAVKTDGTGIINFKIYEENQMLKIEIRDNGPGISKDILHKIYKIGTSTKSSERGYGMYNVKKIIDSYNGTIDFKIKNGTWWYVILPINGSDKI